MKTVENSSNKYVESKTLRDEVIGTISYDFLDKIKVIPYLNDDMVMSVDQVASYYEVGLEAIKTLIKRNRHEFENDGMIVLTGENLKNFLREFCEVQNGPLKNPGKIRNLTLLTKASLLRAGMLLTGSGVAEEVRNYLIQIEKDSNLDRKSWIIQREVGRIERKRMTSAIAKYVPNDKYKPFAYPTYTNLIYDIVFGCTAKDLKEQRGAKQNNLRDYFTEEELKKVEELETIVAGLLSMDFTYKQIEKMIRDRFIKKISNS